MKLYFFDVFHHDKGQFTPSDSPESLLGDNWGLPMLEPEAKTCINALEIWGRRAGAKVKRIPGRLRNEPETIICKGTAGELAVKSLTFNLGPIDDSQESRYRIVLSGCHGGQFTPSCQKRHLGRYFGKSYTKANASKILSRLHDCRVDAGNQSRLIKSPRRGIVACAFKTPGTDFGMFLYTLHREDHIRKVFPALLGRQPDIAISKAEVGEKSFYLIGASINAGKRDFLPNPSEYFGLNWGKPLSLPAAEIALKHLSDHYSAFDRRVFTQKDRKELHIELQAEKSIVLGYVKSRDYRFQEAANAEEKP